MTSASSIALLAQLQLVAGDAGDVQQVVDQPGQVLDLPLDHVAAPAELRLVRPLEAQHLHGVADRGQRVPQFVGQRRQELVLAAVGLLQLVQQPQPLVGDGDVVADGFHEGHFVRRRTRPSSGWRRERAEQPVAGQQRIAGVGPDAEAT